MEKHIQATYDHWIKLLLVVVCLLVVLGTHQVHACDNNPTITILNSAVEKGAVCLDGSPPAYFHNEGYGEGANNWMVYIVGGAWCIDEADCITRSKGYGGSSLYLNSTLNGWTGIISGNQTINPEFYNWNRVFVHYCDGASFAGDIEEVNPKNNLYMRGARIFDAVIEDLLAKGLKDANNAILAGQSAGGLTTILHCDKFREKVPNANRVKCISDGGFFIRGEELAGSILVDLPFGNDMVAFHGIEKFLPKSCTSKMDPRLCMFPENLVGDIKTPLYILNSAVDAYQIMTKVIYVEPKWENCIGGNLNCTAHQLQILKDFRKTFIKALPKRNDSSIGLFIDSCYAHDHVVIDQRWNSRLSPTLKNKNVAQAFGDWYFDRSGFQEIEAYDSPRICPWKL